MNRITIQLLWVLLISACAAEPPFPFEVSLSTVPDNPVPSRSTDFSFRVTPSGDASVNEVTVIGEAHLGATVLKFGIVDETDEVGVFTETGVDLEEGVWDISVTIWGGTDGSGAETTHFQLEVTCDGGGGLANACCSDSNCGGALVCIVGICAPGPSEPGVECWVGSDCVSQVCSSEEVCAEARCDDGAQNGVEVAVDCGGGICEGCPKDTPCTAPADCASGFCEDAVCLGGVPVLGYGRHNIAEVEMVVIGTAADSLSAPRDVAVNPAEPLQLWVVNNLTDSATIIFNAGTTQQWSKWYWDMSSTHFLAAPSALAFGNLDCFQGAGCMATAHETDDLTQGPQAEGGSPPDFMGPTLWPTDVANFDGGFLSHLDMLHNTPNGAGIAWETGNVYWVFDGYHQSLTRYAYFADHDMGGTYHADGVVHRYVENQVSYVPEVHVGMLVDLPNGRLLSVDPGNNRVVSLELDSGTLGGIITPNYDYNEENYEEKSEQRSVTGANLTTFIDGAELGIFVPSGLARYEDVLYLGDYATGYIWAFDVTTGNFLDWVDTGIGANTLSGMDFDATGRLYLADKKGNKVYRLAPIP